MDAVQVLRREHREIDRLLRELQSAGEREARKRKQLRKQLVEELSVHQDLEEQVVYPTAEQEVSKTKPAVLKAREQHELLKGLLRQIEGMQPQEERFDPRVAVLADLTRAHFEEEDATVLIPLADALTADQLRELGRRLEEGRAAIKNPREYLKLD
jgi:hemerythrin-like domain-containing protein